MTKKFSEKANKTEYAKVLVVMCSKFNSVAALLTPPLYYSLPVEKYIVYRCTSLYSTKVLAYSLLRY